MEDEATVDKDIVSEPANAVTDEAAKPSEISLDDQITVAYGEYWNSMIENCKSNGAILAFGVVIDPRFQKPMVVSIGDEYERAKMLAKILRIMKSSIMDELQV